MTDGSQATLGILLSMIQLRWLLEAQPELAAHDPDIHVADVKEREPVRFCTDENIEEVDGTFERYAPVSATVVSTLITGDRYATDPPVPTLHRRQVRAHRQHPQPARISRR